MWLEWVIRGTHTDEVMDEAKRPFMQGLAGHVKGFVFYCSK